MIITPQATLPQTENANPRGRSRRRLAVSGLATVLGLAGLLGWLKLAMSSPALQHLVFRAEPYAGVALIAAGGLCGAIVAVRSRRARALQTSDTASSPGIGQSIRGPLSLALTLILFTWPLIASLTGKARPVWEPGYELFLVPFSDASGYYGGAEIVMSSGTLDSWNVRRPLNVLTLAAPWRSWEMTSSRRWCSRGSCLGWWCGCSPGSSAAISARRPVSPRSGSCLASDGNGRRQPSPNRWG